MVSDKSNGAPILCHKYCLGPQGECCCTDDIARHCVSAGDCGVAKRRLLHRFRSKIGRQSAIGKKTKANTDSGNGRRKITLPSPGKYTLLTRCTNSNGVAQTRTRQIGIPAGFMRNVVEIGRYHCGLTEYLTMFRNFPCRPSFYWAVAVNAFPSLAPPQPFELKSLKIDLPDKRQDVPRRSPVRDAINNNCLACHSA